MLDANFCVILQFLTRYHEGILDTCLFSGADFILKRLGADKLKRFLQKNWRIFSKTFIGWCSLKKLFIKNSKIDCKI